MRTNLCPNPSAEVDTTGYASNGDGVIITRDTTVSRYGSASVKSVPLGTNPATNLPEIPVTPGVTYTISFWLYAASGTATNNLIYGRNPGYYFAGYLQPVGGGGAFTPGVWQRWSGTYTAAPGDTSFLALIGVQSGAAGYFIDGVLVEASRTLLPYFDGDTINCQWTGAAGSSTSINFSQPGSLVRRNAAPNPGFGSGIAGWAASDATWDSATGSHQPGSAKIVASALNSNSYLYYDLPVTPGDTWTISVDYKSGATLGTGWGVYVQCGTIAGVLIPARASWGSRVSFTTTIPAGQTTARFFPLWSYAACAAGDTVWVDEVLIEKVGSAGAYFDGDSVNSIWDGAAGGSTSQQLLPAGLNPNLPVMEWRVWTGENPPSVPNNPTTRPLFLSDRARSVKVDRGRQYELDQDQTGTAEARLVNNDGAIIGGRNNMFPMRRGQFRVSYLGKTYTLYTGYVSTWPDKASDPATSESTLTFVDLMEPLANKPLGPMYINELRSMSPPPDHLWPFSEAAGSTSAVDIMGANATPSAPVVAYTGGSPGALVFGGTSICANDGTTCLSYNDTSGIGTRAQQVQLSGPVAGRNIQIDTTKPWMVSMMLKATNRSTTVFSILDGGGAVFADIEFEVTPGSSTYTLYWHIGGAFVRVDNETDLVTGVNVIIGYDGTSAFYGLNGQVHTVSGYAPRGVVSWVAAGAAFSGTTLYFGADATYSIQDLAMWVGTLPSLAYPGPLSDAYYGALDAYGTIYRDGAVTRDNTTTRLARILKWAGQGGLAGDTYGSDSPPYFNTGWLSNLSDTKGSAPLDLMRQAALNVWGRFFISKDGLPTFQSKDHGQTLVNPAYVFGSNTSGGEFPYTGSPSFEYDVVHVYNDVQVSVPSYSLPHPDSTTTQKGAVYRWLNDTSIAKYFTRVLQTSTELLQGEEAQRLSQFIASRYGEPDYRIGDIVLDPMGFPALWPVVLGLELGDVVQVNHRDLNGTRSGVFSVAKIRHEGTGGESWKTTLSLTPFHQYWLLAAMHTTFAASCLAGATSISLNPLPDSATNPAEASLGVGTTIMLEPGTANAEIVTITSVASAPTPHAAGYASITLGVTATAHAHSAGAVACDPLPSGVTDPSTWDARSVLGSTTVLNA